MNLELLDQGIRQMHRTGVGYVQGALSNDYCRQLLNEVETDRRRRPAGKYRLPQEPTWVVDYVETKNGPVLSGLVQEFGQAVRANATADRNGGAASLGRWYPNEAVFQGYPNGGGISVHRDLSICNLLIAIFNLHGRACLEIDRYSPDWVSGGSWNMQIGDLALLRGTKFQGVSFYGRPRHRIHDCHDDRVSLVLRMMSPITA